MKTLYLHELRTSKLSLIIWTAAISFMLGICVLIYPEMQTQMGDIGDMFSDMGAFSDAFGMSMLNFGEFMGYFGIECSNTLGLGGALFAAVVGVTALAKEERNRTAEFLLTHPVSRQTVLTSKLLAAFTQVVILNLAAIAVTVIGVLAMELEADIGKMALLFLAHLILHLEICAITFGISAFMRRGEIGVGMGVAFGFYFLNILANLTKELKFLKYITPFGYADSSFIIPEGKIKLAYLAIGILFSAVGIVIGYLKYTKKDIT